MPALSESSNMSNTVFNIFKIMGQLILNGNLGMEMVVLDQQKLFMMYIKMV